MGAAPAPSSSSGSPDLAWLEAIVFEGAGARDGAGPRLAPGGSATRESWLAVPNAGAPQLLVPLASRAAAAAAVRRYNDGLTWPARARAGLVHLALRAGLAQPALRQRVHLAGGAEPVASLKEHLEAVLGRRDLAVAVTLGPRRVKRKPVLQLVTVAGETVAFAKVGWDAPSRALLANEGDFLELVARRRPAGVVAPEVLHRGEWRGRGLLVLAALPVRFGTAGRRRAPPVAAARAVAGLVEAPSALLATSAYWAAVRAGLGVPTPEETALRPGWTTAARPEGTDGASSASGGGAALGELVARVEERFGDAAVDLGAAHGDFSPWNMATVRGRLLLWDWEEARAPVPVGFDLWHYGAQVASLLEHAGGDAAVAAAWARGAPAVRALGLPEAGARLSFVLFLLDLCLRCERDLAVMDVPRLRELGAAAARRLAAELA